MHIITILTIIQNSSLYIVSFGAAITVFSGTLPETFSNVLYNPLCFLVYEFEQTPPNEWNVCYYNAVHEILNKYISIMIMYNMFVAIMQVSLNFIGNSATLGSIGYLGSVKSCSWNQLKYPNFNISKVLRWDFVDQK